MSTTLELPDDVASALTNRAKRVGQGVQDAGVQLLRQALATDAQLRSTEVVDPTIRGHLETDPKTGLPVIRCAADAPARRMTLEQLLALEQETLLEQELERLGLPH